MEKQKMHNNQLSFKHKADTLDSQFILEIF